jgi:hypothetical protein
MVSSGNQPRFFGVFSGIAFTSMDSTVPNNVVKWHPGLCPWHAGTSVSAPIEPITANPVSGWYDWSYMHSEPDACKREVQLAAHKEQGRLVRICHYMQERQCSVLSA